MALNLTAALIAILVFSCQIFFMEFSSNLTMVNEGSTPSLTDTKADISKPKSEVFRIPHEGKVLNYNLVTFTAIQEKEEFTSVFRTNMAAPWDFSVAIVGQQHQSTKLLSY